MKLTNEARNINITDDDRRKKRDDSLTFDLGRYMNAGVQHPNTDYNTVILLFFKDVIQSLS